MKAPRAAQPLPPAIEEAILIVETGLPVPFTLDNAPEELVQGILVYKAVKNTLEYGGSYNPN